MLERVKNKISIPHLIAISVSFVLTLLTITGTLFTIDDRWAKAADVKLVELRLDQKIYSDRLHNIQQRMWSLEDRYGEEKYMPPAIKEEYRRLKQEYIKTKMKLEQLYHTR